MHAWVFPWLFPNRFSSSLGGPLAEDRLWPPEMCPVSLPSASSYWRSQRSPAEPGGRRPLVTAEEADPLGRRPPGQKEVGEAQNCAEETGTAQWGVLCIDFPELIMRVVLRGAEKARRLGPGCQQPSTVVSCNSLLLRHSPGPQGFLLRQIFLLYIPFNQDSSSAAYLKLTL